MLTRGDFDTARFTWTEIEPGERMRRGQLFLVAPSGNMIEWGGPLDVTSMFEAHERLSGWALDRPESGGLAEIVRGLSAAQRRTVAELPQAQRPTLHPSHFHNDATARVLVRKGLSDWWRLTDLGLLVHHFIHASAS